MNSVRRAGIVLALLAAGTAARAQGPDPANIRGESTQTRKRLAEAEQKLIAGKTADATDDLQRVLDEAPDDLIALDGKHYRTARRVAHGILARLPADALKSYQDRIDNPARKLFDTAKQTRDPAPLWQLLDRYFVSRPAEDGLLLLGDLLFERGEFRTAENVWRRLLPDAGADIVYPNSRTDLAAVRARVILAMVFQGDTDRAKAELTAFTKQHPGAKGLLAGKDAPYADTLRAVLDHPPQLAPAANAGADWPTFGGAPDRAGRAGVRLPDDWRANRWEQTIPGVRHLELSPTPPARPPFGNPVIVNGQVFVTDGWRICGFDLGTGRQTADLVLARRDDGTSRGSEPSPTLTAAGNRLYVRVGPGVIRPADLAKRGDDTTIACVLLTAKADGTPTLKELWRLKPPPAEEKTAIAWEGAPLVAGRRMWAAYARFEGGRVVHGIACYDPADAASAPDRPAWTADVCDGSLSAADGRARHELLTLAGRNVVFCSNAGAVVALDAATGRRAWGFRYPRVRKAEANLSPDPAPAVACGGRVFVAPADADCVHALDPETGQLLWSSKPTEGAQILGVSAGRLIVTVTGPTKGIRGLNVRNGEYGELDGWIQGTSSAPPGYGRGFVTDDVIVWPTQDGLYFLNSDDGTPRGEAWTHPSGWQGRYFGNVAYADGVLVVVTATQVWGYVSAAKRFGPAEPRSEREKFNRLIEAGERALAAGETSTARQLLLDVARGELPKPFRAWAAARLLLLTPKTDAESKLPADVRSALAAELRDEWLIPPDGVPVTLATLLDRHLGRERASAFLPSSPALPCDRKPEDAPSLSPDAEINRTLRLAVGSVPLRWIPGMATPPKRLFTTTATELLAVSLTNRDSSRHDAVDRFTHATDIHDGFVVAGPFAVAVYGTAREPLWVFRVPTTPPLTALPGKVWLSSEPPPVAELSSFRLVGSWLVARLGERHLIAFDLQGKRVAWVLGANGKPGFRTLAFPGATRFGAEFAATGQLVVAQLSDGRRWFIRASTGNVLDVPGFGEQTAKVWWPHPPVEIDGSRLLLSDGPGLVRVLNLTTGREKWTHEPVGEASLTGEPPQVRAWADALLIAVRRNHGVELDRLDTADGKSAWRSGAAFLDADRVKLANADADAERVYVPVGNTLAAFHLKDGKSAWEVELPDARGSGGWVVRSGQKCLIAYPEFAVPREPVVDVLDRVAKSFRNEPAFWRLPGLVVGLYDAWVARTVPVLLLDPETGKRLGTFEIPATGPAVTTWFERDLAVVATGDRVVWLR
jgi:outer membrane protein assembly factor BamB